MEAPRVDLIAPIDPELPGRTRAKLLEESIYAPWQGDADDEPERMMSERDVELLRAFAQDRDFRVRAVAVSFLSEFGPCTMADIHRWCFDTSHAVRQQVVWTLSSRTSAAGKLCCQDKQQCVDLIGRVARRYNDYAAGQELHNLTYTTERVADIESDDYSIANHVTHPDPEYIELTWRAANKLLDLRRPALTVMLACCYFEHVIPDNKWGPEDEHIAPWVYGEDSWRKLLLLDIARYWRLDAGCMGAIAEALRGDSDTAIAWMAKAVLRGHSLPLPFGEDYYETIRSRLASKWLVTD